MSSIATMAAGAGGLVRRDFFVFTSYRARMVVMLGSSFVSIALFYYISRLVRVSQFESADSYFAFAVVGIAIMEVVSSTLNALPMRIRQELVAGTFERMVISPLGAVSAIGAMTLFPLALALITAASSIAFAGLVFGLDLHWATVPLAVPIALIAGLAFTPFAMIVAGAVLAFKQAGSASAFIVTGLSFVGGFLFPVSLLPSWIQWASEVQPFTPAVELLRHFLVNTPMDDGSVSAALVKLVLFGVALFPVGIWVLKLSIRYGQRTGTVTEY